MGARIPRMKLSSWCVALACASAVGCGSSDGAPRDVARGARAAEAARAVKAYVSSNLDELVSATVDLRAHAPIPDADGWNAVDDAAAVAAMRSSWKQARLAYERIEGAIAVLFPEIDRYTDERYDAFLGEGTDTDLFDGEGVTGVHAVERILFSDVTPPQVIAFESKLAGYVQARFPKTEAEARGFRDDLLGRLVSDVTKMRDDFAPLELDLAAALYGVMGSMTEQVEKMNRASLGAEESRYAQFTLADMRANVEGGETLYAAFRPWLGDSARGRALDTAVLAGFGRLDVAYGKLAGDALPTKPDSWSKAPSAPDRETPFGALWVVVQREGDRTDPASLASSMREAGDALALEEP